MLFSSWKQFAAEKEILQMIAVCSCPQPRGGHRCEESVDQWLLSLACPLLAAWEAHQDRDREASYARGYCWLLCSLGPLNGGPNFLCECPVQHFSLGSTAFNLVLGLSRLGSQECTGLSRAPRDRGVAHRGPYETFRSWAASPGPLNHPECAWESPCHTNPQ